MHGTVSKKKAVVYRMVMPDHTCPFGLKTIDLLKRRGFEVEDRPLRTRAETDALKAELNVKTTPQTFVDGQRIGGHDDVRRFLGLAVQDPDAVSYRPVIVVFVVSALIALAASYAANATIEPSTALRWFLAITTAILAMLKLQDLSRFSTMFLNYDLLAKRWVPYATVYPFAELLVGVLMIAGALAWLSAPVAIFIGSIGAWSVFKAVYIDKRSLKCACVGGNSKVPLGFVSLTENIAMIAMGIWMLAAMVN
ncbi:MAG TPA: MauE/DoxX family redox-associated membrane protein [Tianweitania sediminis]|jgi:glutaredoxin|nr:MauE/DoxX family redox-associated membrane protein [Tianweitania sediminis]